MAWLRQAFTTARGPDAPREGWERERKFVTTSRSLRAFLERIETRTALEVHDAARPATWNRTTYLDTHDFAYLNSAREGRTSRKLRIREYASAASPLHPPRLSGLCFLELKETGGSFRSKTRVPADPSLLLRMLEGPGVAEAELDGTLRVFQRLIQCDRPLPKLTTWYRRITRVSRNRALRITIDSDLCFAQPVLIGTESLRTAAPQSPVERVSFSVVEVKSDGELPDWLRRAVASLHEVQEFSKFRRGMAVLFSRTR